MKFFALSFAVFVGAASATLFSDCGDANAVIHFSLIESDPDPVIVGGNQTIVKKGWADVDVPSQNFTATFSQYWCPESKEKCTASWKTGPWVRFLKINVNVCEDHPDMCPLKSGKISRRPPSILP